MPVVLRDIVTDFYIVLQHCGFIGPCISIRYQVSYQDCLRFTVIVCKTSLVQKQINTSDYTYTDVMHFPWSYCTPMCASKLRHTLVYPSHTHYVKCLSPVNHASQLQANKAVHIILARDTLKSAESV